MLPKWKYALRKGDIAEQREQLNYMRQMFLFIMVAMKDVSQQLGPLQHQPGGTRDPGGMTGSSQSQPIILQGPGTDSSGAPVFFSATLSMRPLQSNTATGRAAREYDPRSKPTAAAAIRPPDYLKTLRQSPYFSAEMLKPRAVPESRAYSPRTTRRDPAVDRIVARESMKRESHITEPAIYYGSPSRPPKSRKKPARYSGREEAKLKYERERYDDDSDASSDSVLLPDDQEAAEDVDDLLTSVRRDFL